MVRNAQGELSEALVPFPVTDTRIAFSSGTVSVVVTATLKRDYPIGEDERLQLARLLGRTLDLPVVLKVTAVPLLPPLFFDAADALTSASSGSLELIKQLPGGSGAFRYVLESPSRKGIKKVSMLKRYLTQELGVPDKAITVRSTRTAIKSGAVTLRIVRR